MHSTVVQTDEGTYVCNHHGDYSGRIKVMVNINPPDNAEGIKPATLHWKDSTFRDPRSGEVVEQHEIEIPFEVMFQLVADKVRREMISKIESMSSGDLLKYLTELV